MSVINSDKLKKPKHKVLLPQSTIGIFGGGQLGMMTAMAAITMGYRIAVLDPDPNAPAMQLANIKFISDYHDIDAVKRMAQTCDVLTYEFENITLESIESAEDITPVFPSSAVLRCARHRAKEKQLITLAGGKVAPYCVVTDLASMERAIQTIGVPSVLKTTTSGYDGKGQEVIKQLYDWRMSFEKLYSKSKELILEKCISLEKEISVIVSREGRLSPFRKCFFPIAQNLHKEGILDVTTAPADIKRALADNARTVAGNIADALDVTGLLTVEMFISTEGELLVNELAPRPHNSGHFTIEGCVTSQFQQLVRILTGNPMGDVTQRGCATMVNLLGDLWLDCEPQQPNWSGVLSFPSVYLHLYRKSQVRRGRKMGHITAIANSVEEANKKAKMSREFAIPSYNK